LLLLILTDFIFQFFFSFSLHQRLSGLGFIQFHRHRLHFRSFINIQILMMMMMMMMIFYSAALNGQFSFTF